MILIYQSIFETPYMYVLPIVSHDHNWHKLIALTRNLDQVQSSSLFGETIRPSSTLFREFKDARVTSSTSIFLERLISSSIPTFQSKRHTRRR